MTNTRLGYSIAAALISVPESSPTNPHTDIPWITGAAMTRYTDHEQENYLPPPCPECGSETTAVSWISTIRGLEPDPNDKTWTVWLRCTNPDCNRHTHGWSG